MTRLSLKGARNRYGIFLPSVVHKSVLRGYFNYIKIICILNYFSWPLNS